MGRNESYDIRLWGELKDSARSRQAGISGLQHHEQRSRHGKKMARDMMAGRI
jgi:hypothetical protein